MLLDDVEKARAAAEIDPLALGIEKDVVAIAGQRRCLTPTIRRELSRR